jgi:hypothetical protein
VYLSVHVGIILLHSKNFAFWHRKLTECQPREATRAGVAVAPSKTWLQISRESPGSPFSAVLSEEMLVQNKTFHVPILVRFY